MEWQHYNRIKASMSYIEGLIKEIKEDISGKSEIYKSIKNDLTQEQLKEVKEELRQIKIQLEKAKKDFDLDNATFALSHIINVNCSFIWETIDDLWPRKLEKSSGPISSQQKKEKLDAILKQLYEHTNQLKIIIKK
jgi:ribosomal protein S13